jgi:hypothetical protein
LLRRLVGGDLITCLWDIDAGELIAGLKGEEGGGVEGWEWKAAAKGLVRIGVMEREDVPLGLRIRRWIRRVVQEAPEE